MHNRLVTPVVIKITTIMITIIKITNNHEYSNQDNNDNNDDDNSQDATYDETNDVSSFTSIPWNNCLTKDGIYPESMCDSVCDNVQTVEWTINLVDRTFDGK